MRGTQELRPIEPKSDRKGRLNMFETFNAAQYRALDDAAFEQRKSQVIELMSAETLPEGVTDEMLYAEADLIEADTQRRNKAVALRKAKVEKVVEAAPVVESNKPAEKRESGFKAVSEASFTDSIEYRRALANHIAHVAPMSNDFMAKAVRERQSRAAGDPIAVSFADGYTNVTDPTFAQTVSTSPLMPLSISDEIIQERSEAGVLQSKVNVTYFPGGYAVPISDLTVDFHWINDKQVSPYQYDSDIQTVLFGYHQLEARFARTFLVQALLSDNYKQILSPKFTEGYGRAIDSAIIGGTGSTNGQPLGILKDPRVMDQTSGAGTGKATVIEASSDDLTDWKFWNKALFKGDFNRLYRTDGEWIIGDSTFGTYLLSLHDEVNRPLVRQDLRNADAMASLFGNTINVMPNTILPDFDTAATGAVIAIFMNPRNYTLNFQPGMPISTVSWDDHETNTHKTKVLTAVDGRVIDNNGIIVITKKAQG